MRLLHLTLYHFRGFKKQSFTFTPHIQHFVGDNAHGKTTLLEAIYFLATGHSFRTSHLTDLVMYDKEAFALDLQFESFGFSQHLQVQSNGKEHKVLFNNTHYSTLHQLFGLIPGVVITTEDVDIIKKGPEERRLFLDLYINALDPLYVYHTQRFRRALKQRNFMLKQRKIQHIDIFEIELAKSAAYLNFARKKALTNLEPICDKYLNELSVHHDKLSIEYKTLANELLSIKELEALYIETYKKTRPKDQEIQTTTIGPHREDMIFNLNGKPAKLFASEGQKRTLANSLKFAQYEILEQNSNQKPFLCIDDVGISLDLDRTERLLKTLENIEQVFITSPHLLPDFKGQVFELQNFAIAK